MATLTFLLAGDLFGDMPPTARIVVDGGTLIEVPVSAKRGETPQRVNLMVPPGRVNRAVQASYAGMAFM